MWTFYHFLGEVLQRPSERTERVTLWVVGVIAGLIAWLMIYAWWTAPTM